MNFAMDHGMTDAIAAERVLPEIEHAIGAPRQAILDHPSGCCG
jgi:hypothetical protein